MRSVRTAPCSGKPLQVSSSGGASLKRLDASLHDRLCFVATERFLSGFLHCLNGRSAFVTVEAIPLPQG
jgi:hypothetical protein